MTGVIATFKDLGYTIAPLLAGFLIEVIDITETRSTSLALRSSSSCQSRFFWMTDVVTTKFQNECVNLFFFQFLEGWVLRGFLTHLGPE